MCKAPVKLSPSTDQIPSFLQARCLSCHPTNSVRALKVKSIVFYILPYPTLTWGCFFDHLRLLVTLGRVAKPLVSPLIPVQQLKHIHDTDSCNKSSKIAKTTNMLYYVCTTPCFIKKTTRYLIAHTFSKC